MVQPRIFVCNCAMRFNTSTCFQPHNSRQRGFARHASVPQSRKSLVMFIASRAIRNALATSFRLCEGRPGVTFGHKTFCLSSTQDTHEHVHSAEARHESRPRGFALHASLLSSRKSLDMFSVEPRGFSAARLFARCFAVCVLQWEMVRVNCRQSPFGWNRSRHNGHGPWFYCWCRSLSPRHHVQRQDPWIRDFASLNTNRAARHASEPQPRKCLDMLSVSCAYFSFARAAPQRKSTSSLWRTRLRKRQKDNPFCERSHFQMFIRGSDRRFRCLSPESPSTCSGPTARLLPLRGARQHDLEVPAALTLTDEKTGTNHAGREERRQHSRAIERSPIIEAKLFNPPIPQRP